MITFLEPQDDWVRWLIDHAAGRLIVDVGCGNGQLTRAIVEAGYDGVIGLDMYWDFERVLNMSPEDRERFATKYAPFEAPCELTRAPDLLLVMARPSHGGWVGDVIRAADPTAEVLYVSMPHNVDVDLWADDLRVEPVSTPAPGLDEERVYRVWSTQQGAMAA